MVPRISVMTCDWQEISTDNAMHIPCHVDQWLALIVVYVMLNSLVMFLKQPTILDPVMALWQMKSVNSCGCSVFSKIPRC